MIDHDTLSDWLREGRAAELKWALWPLTPPEAAEVLRNLPPAQMAALLRVTRDPAEVFAYLSPAEQQALLRGFTHDEARETLHALDPDDRARLVGALPADVARPLLDSLPEEDLREVRALLGYPTGSVGRLMTPHFVAVRADWSISEALRQVRERGRDDETTNVVYVVDDAWRLVDALALRVFVLADPREQVGAVMDHRFVCLEVTAPREEAVRLMAWHDLEALPVTDAAGVLVGVVTFDDALDAAEAEATEDFERFGAVQPLSGRPGRTGWSELYRKRIGWLVLLVFFNLISGTIIARYEDVITELAVLVVFLPLLIGSSGNAGSQAATLTVRALATHDVGAGDWAKLMSREVLVSGLLGLTMGVAIAAVGVFRGGWSVAGVVALTMIAVVIIGSMIGASLPFVLQRLKLDPATASAPLVTSIADVAGVTLYFAMARWLLLP